MTPGGDADLRRALQLSEQLVAAADLGEMIAVSQLDSERRLLIESFRRRVRLVEAMDQHLLNEIALLNDKSLGVLEHHRRLKEREMDMASVGRRAVAAYARTSVR